MWPDGDEGRVGGNRDVGKICANHDTGRGSSSSDVMPVEDRMISLTRNGGVPNVASLNVTKSSRVHIGPKFVSVTQTVQNNEVVKGRILGLELVSKKHPRRVRCSVAVFVCWTIIVTFGLAFYLFRTVLYREQTRLDMGIEEDWYLRRGDWQARPPYQVNFLQLPVPNVVIAHSVGHFCLERHICIRDVLNIQNDNFNRGYYDIGPNFLVSPNGLIFEGRGANVFPAMVSSWNSKSMTLLFMGNYIYNATSQVQFDHVNKILDVLVDKGVLTRDYAVYGFCQLKTYTVSPGPAVMNSMRNFSHWDPVNANKCLQTGH